MSIRLGDFKRWAALPIRHYGEGGALVLGASGSGKTASVLIPTAMEMRFGVILDIDGQIGDVCGPQWAKNKIEVQTVAPWENGKKFNPLSIINPRHPSAASISKALARSQFRSADLTKGDGAIWASSAMALLVYQQIYARLQSTVPQKDFNLVRKQIMASAGEWNTLLGSMTTVQDEDISQAAKRILEQKDKSGRIFESVKLHLVEATDWIADKAIRSTIDGEEVDFAKIKGLDGERGAIIRLVIPQEFVSTQASFIRVFMTYALLTLMSGQVAREEVLFIIDEFPSLGYMETVLQALNQMRRFKLRMVLAGQGWGQIEDIYGRYGVQTIEEGCPIRVCLGANSEGMAEHYSNLCGKTTVWSPAVDGSGRPSMSAHSRPLIMPDEILQMPWWRMIVVIAGMKPMKLRKRPYYDIPWMRKVAGKTRFHNAMPRPLLTMPLQIAIGRVLWAFAWIVWIVAGIRKR